VICSVSLGAILTHCVRKVQLRLIHAQVSGADSKAKHEVVPVGAEKDNLSPQVPGLACADDAFSKDSSTFAVN